MFDRFGMVQFARGEAKDLGSGYCVDDNARALICAVAALRLDPKQTDADRIGRASLDFVAKAQLDDGGFHNLMDESGEFTDREGSEDSIGRAVWACGIAARCAPDDAQRARAESVLLRALPRAAKLAQLRPRGYALLGLMAAVGPARASAVAPSVEAVSAPLFGAASAQLGPLAAAWNADFRRAATDEWPWWEDELSWGNARLPEVSLRSALACEEPAYAVTGLRALGFLSSVTQPHGIFVPIGNRGWYRRGGIRPLYDQQPIEACGMVDAWLAAHAVTRDPAYHDQALTVFEWFFGRNTDELLVARPEIGGCYDGLEPGRVNRNMGAESTLSYLQAHLSIAHATRPPTPSPMV